MLLPYSCSVNRLALTRALRRNEPILKAQFRDASAWLWFKVQRNIFRRHYPLMWAQVTGVAV